MKNMKKLFLTVLSMSALMVSACSGGTVEDSSSAAPAPSSQSTSSQSGGETSESTSSTSQAPAVTVSLLDSELELTVGEDATLYVTVSGASEGDIEWLSSDEDVATVSNGVLTAVGEGEAIITARIGDAQDFCAVTVVADEQPTIANTYRLIYGIPGEADATWGYGSGVKGTTLAGDSTILDQAKYVVELSSASQGFKFYDGKEDYVGSAVAEMPYYNPEDGDIMPGKAGKFEVYLKRVADGFSVGIVRVNPNLGLKEFTVTLNSAPTAGRTLIGHGWGNQGEENVTPVVDGSNVTLTFTKQINGFLIAELLADKTELGEDWVNVDRQTENFEAADYVTPGTNNLAWKGSNSGNQPVGEGFFLVGTHNGWAASNSAKLSADSTIPNKYYISGVTFAANDEIKVTSGNDWYGNASAWDDCGFTVLENGNVKVSVAGSYTVDFYPNAENGNHIVLIGPGDPPSEQPGGEDTPIAAGYYLVGTHNSWTTDNTSKMTVDPEDSNHYSISGVELAAGGKLKVRTAGSEYYSNAGLWNGCGFTLDEEANIVVTTAGTYTINFYVVGDYNNHIVLKQEGVEPVAPTTTSVAVTLDTTFTTKYSGRTYFIHSWKEGVEPYTDFFTAAGDVKILSGADGYLVGVLKEGKTKDDSVGGNGWPNVDAKTVNQTTIPTASLAISYSNPNIALALDGGAPVAPVSNVVNLYFTSPKGWTSVKAYVWKGTVGQVAWPGTDLEKIGTNDFGESIYKVSVDLAKYDSIIFNNGADAQTVDIDISSKSENDAFYVSGGENNALTVGTWIYVPAAEQLTDYNQLDQDSSESFSYTDILIMC